MLVETACFKYSHNGYEYIAISDLAFTLTRMLYAMLPLNATILLTDKSLLIPITE